MWVCCASSRLFMLGACATAYASRITPPLPAGSPPAQRAVSPALAQPSCPVVRRVARTQPTINQGDNRVDGVGVADHFPRNPVRQELRRRTDIGGGGDVAKAVWFV
jgi:hypothetical protein